MRRRVEEVTADQRDLVTALLQQAERCAVVGLPDQAEGILAQIWTMVVGSAPDLASATAWDLAWLLARRGAYAEATAWLHRIETAPSQPIDLWPLVRQALIDMCLALASTSPDEAALQPPRCVHAYGTGSDSALPALQVVNLGHFQITRAGELLPVCKSHKAIALFRYLLTQRHHAVHKEVLMELFWPDSPPHAARSGLHAAICALRRHIDPPGGSYVLFEDDHYALDPGASLDDEASAFERMSVVGEHCWRSGDLEQAQRAYSQAIRCYQGDYYVDSRDAGWASAVREHLLTRYLSALDHLGQILIGQGLYEQASECYQRLFERDSYREDAYRQLMRCYWQLNRRHDALRQYEQCVTLLAKDLGLEPMEETRALSRTILEQTSPTALVLEQRRTVRSSAVKP
jgi:DNA-binding SARP family transcriptional activator